MTSFTFTPTDEQKSGIQVPCLEDARSDFAPYYTSFGNGYTIQKAQNDVLNELAKLGAGGVLFREGYFGVGATKRFGYTIEFQYGGASGVIRVAGLPICKGTTNKKIEQVRIQALLNVRDWLKVAVTARVFNPGADPLVQYLLVDGQNTVVDLMYDRGYVPQLQPPAVDGEVIS